MNVSKLIDEIEAEQLKSDIPDFNVGDTISIHFRIIEGDKERIQVFTGVVIARKGRGISETISIYRIAYGSAMERVFPLHSPKVAKIEIVKLGKVRKSKLYYLRGVFGKKAKVQERIVLPGKKGARKEETGGKVDEIPESAEEVKGEEAQTPPAAEKTPEKKEDTSTPSTEE
ncbi:MAG: 50S ribosomal protein L19 [Chlamydiae bacterium]|nr:50S ribosomal protein L19 [Chlamydiota bacterium]